MSARDTVVGVDEVRHVALLARIGLTDERALALTHDLNTILAHMEVLRGVDTRGVDEAAGVGAGGMRLRKDAGPPTPLAAPPSEFAPDMRGGFFIVPRLATHDGLDASASGEHSE